MFSSKRSHPQGQGEYVLARALDGSWEAHACHSPYRNHVSVNRGFAVRFTDSQGRVWVVKHLRGSQAIIPQGCPVTLSGDLMQFPGGERIRGSGRHAHLRLPVSKYCERVEGLCGRASPDLQWQDAFTNAAGAVGSYPDSWAKGPFGGVCVCARAAVPAP